MDIPLDGACPPYFLTKMRPKVSVVGVESVVGVVGVVSVVVVRAVVLHILQLLHLVADPGEGPGGPAPLIF